MRPDDQGNRFIQFSAARTGKRTDSEGPGSDCGGQSSSTPSPWQLRRCPPPAADQQAPRPQVCAAHRVSHRHRPHVRAAHPEPPQSASRIMHQAREPTQEEPPNGAANSAANSATATAWSDHKVPHTFSGLIRRVRVQTLLRREWPHRHHFVAISDTVLVLNLGHEMTIPQASDILV